VSDRDIDRRGWLKVVGTGAVAGLAGCSGSGGGGGSGEATEATTESEMTEGDGTTAGSGGGSMDTFTVGAVYPFSGAVAETGQNIRSFLQSAVDDVINSTADLGPLVMAGEEGLPNLGASVEITFADHRSDPNQGRAEAERMVQEEDVDLLVGAYNSSVTKTVSQVAEREQIPHVNFESSSPDLTERGLNWFWRTGPTDQTYTQNMFTFFQGLNEQMDAGIETVAIVHEDTEFGTVSARTQEALAQENGLEVVAGPIAYTAESVSSLQSQLQRVQEADPDVLLPSSYLRDAQIMMNDLETLGYAPPMIMAQNAGFNQPNFVDSTGVSDFVCTRSTFADDLPENVPELGTYNQFVQDAVGAAFNGVYIRSWGGFVSTMHAINEAGSADPSAIQSAVDGLELDRLETGMPYGISFDDNNQNELASGVLLQYQDGVGNSIWPFELAASEVTYPAPGWGER
jgi:branched-chain amino acid transport system substrate-binding protein